MKKYTIFLLSFFIYTFVSAQSDRKVDESGNLLYQYTRNIESDPQFPGKAVVSFVFVNGNKQLAISYKQEVFRSVLCWKDTLSGSTSKENNIEIITANLAPKASVAWKFLINNKTINKNKSIDIEKAAIMVMDDKYAVSKTVFPETNKK